MSLLHEATARVSRAAGPVVTHDLGRPSRTGDRPTRLLLLGRNIPPPRQTGSAGHFTGLHCHVTSVAFRTAVLAIIAADGLGRSKVITSIQSENVSNGGPGWIDISKKENRAVCPRPP